MNHFRTIRANSSRLTIKCPKSRRLWRVGIACFGLVAAGAASASVVDISNSTTPADIGNPSLGVHVDSVVGGGNSGRLVGLTQTVWYGQGFTMPLDLNGNTLIIDSGGGNEPYGAHAEISGAGDVIFDTVWDHPITVDAGSTYSGTTLIRRGWIQLNATPGQDALRGSITVGGTDRARLVWSANDQISDTSTVTVVNTGSRLDLAGRSEEVGDLYLLTGTAVQTGAGGVLKVARLFLDGVEQPQVAKIAGDGFVLGSGYIEVGSSGPPVITDPPSEPLSPTPANLVTNVHPALLTTLDWADCARASSYDVYFWLSTDTKPATPTANVSLSEYTLPAQVLSLSTYNWQVVAKNVIGDTPGIEWTFDSLDRSLVPGNDGVGYSEGTHSLDFIVGVGNSGVLLGRFTVAWWGGGGSFTVPVNTNGFVLNADTGGGNGGHVATGPISGSGSFVITHGPSGGAWNDMYTINGTAPNTYEGGTIINRGQVQMIKTAGVDALPAPTITLGSVDDSARLFWGASDQVNDLAQINVLLPTVSGGGDPDSYLNFLDLAGNTDTIASLILPDDGTKTQVRTGAGGVLTVTSLSVNGSVLPVGTYTSANSTFVMGSGSVNVVSPTSNFPTWIAARGLSGLDAGFGADPDFDGITNGIEFVIGGEPNPANPNSNSLGMLPTGEIVGGDFVFTYTRTDDAAYLNPSVQFSTSPESGWTTAADPANATIQVIPGSPADVVIVTIPRGANDKLFVRLRVSN